MPQEDPLKADHKEVDKILDQAFAAVERGDKRQTLANLDYLWARLAMHIRAEHLHLFPVLLQKARDPGLLERLADVVRRLPDEISTLRRDHDFFVKEIYKDVNLLRGSEKEKRENVDLDEIHRHLMIIAGRLEVHNRLEEIDVYPLAQALLTVKEISELEVSMSRELTKLPPRFGNIQFPFRDKIDG